MTDADIHYYFDPLCPFAWMTSKGVRQVAAQRDYTVPASRRTGTAEAGA
jgi:predicted DsbA family dithiol-disulfide isomerase